MLCPLNYNGLMEELLSHCLALIMISQSCYGSIFGEGHKQTKIERKEVRTEKHSVQ